jgi:hypothetical protein
LGGPSLILRGLVICFGIDEGGVDWDATVESIEASLR